jgi:hypothetical protein
MADGDALHIARTKASSAVGLSEDTRKTVSNRLSGVLSNTLSTSTKGWSAFSDTPAPGMD